jgi:aspartokinase
MKSLNDDKDAFYTYCRGVNESTVITSTSVSDKIREIFKKEKLKSHTSDLASITIKLPTVNTEISGIYYYILKHLAWEGINIVEVVSTANEFTVVVKSDDIDSVFSVLMQLKKSGKISE